MAGDIRKWLQEQGLTPPDAENCSTTKPQQSIISTSANTQESTSKRCPRCGLIKEISLFTRKSGVVQPYCKPCMQSYSQARYQLEKVNYSDCVICGDKTKLNICKRCKAGLELFGNDMGNLSKAIAYLMKIEREK